MKLPEDLYPYQKEDVERIIESEDNFLNLSDPGTGKTPVGIGTAILGGHTKTLVVCPKRLQLEWSRQILDWTGEAPSVARRGCYRRLEPLFEDILKGRNSPFFVVNYETFRTRRHLDILNAYPFDLIIMDEAHRLRNPRRKQTKGMWEFLRNHQEAKVLLLTGSPIVNNPADLHTLLCMARPKEFSFAGRDFFIDKWCLWTPTRYGRKVTGVKDMGKLREYTKPYTIRHTKEECIPWLPEKYFRTVLLDMERVQREYYESMEQEFFIELDDAGGRLSAPGVLARLMRLRQINLEPRILGLKATSSKTKFILDLVEDTVADSEDGPIGNGGKKLVIFSCFESYVQYLHALLPVDHVIITGGVSMVEQAKSIQRFQTDPKVKVAIGTIQSMGEGITLTAADTVVMADRWWNPAVNNQAIDRLHRIGQKNAVQVVLPVNSASIDQSLDKILATKAGIVDSFMGEEEGWSSIIDDLREARRNYHIEDDYDDEEED